MKTLSNKNAKTTTIIEKVDSPIKIQGYPKITEGKFGLSWPKDDGSGKEMRSAKKFVMTLLHAAYHVEERKDKREIFGEWFLDMDTPIKLWRKDTTHKDSGNAPMFDGKARSYKEAKQDIKDAEGKLVLNLIGFVDNGTLINVKLTGSTLSAFYKALRTEKVDLSETPTITFDYVGGKTYNNPKRESEVFHIPNFSFEELTTDRSDAMDDEAITELTAYMEYKLADAPAADPAEEYDESHAAHVSESTIEDAPEASDEPPVFPTTEKEEVFEEGDEDLPFD